MKIEHTERNFEIINFEDSSGNKCSLQASSAIGDKPDDFENPGTSFIWLGMEGKRMHLNHAQVLEITEKLMSWLSNGNFEGVEKEK